MKSFVLAIMLISLTLLGCSHPKSAHSASDHPATHDAPSADLANPSKTLGWSPKDASDNRTPPGPGAAEHAHAMDVRQPASASDHSSHSDHTNYACPMHPEVTQDQPGNCPKCGMALVKKAPATAGGGSSEHRH
jgi:hypothetical protein